MKKLLAIILSLLMLAKPLNAFAAIDVSVLVVAVAAGVVPPRGMRLFEGFTIKFINGTMKLSQQ